MTNPILATTKWDGTRTYTHPLTGQTVPSVTTVLQVINKPALKAWTAKTVAEYAVDYQPSWTGLPRNDAVDIIKKAATNYSQEAADAGTDVHEYAEKYLLNKTPDPNHQFVELAGNAYHNIRTIIETVKPEVITLECTAWNEQLGYAGSFDGLHLIDHNDGNGPVLTLTDIKTNTAVFADMALQLAAYKYATHIILDDGNQIPMPKVARCQIWHAPKIGEGRAVDITVDYDEFAAFTAALDLWKWQQERAKQVVPKAPPAPRKPRTTKKTLEGKK